MRLNRQETSSDLDRARETASRLGAGRGSAGALYALAYVSFASAASRQASVSSAPPAAGFVGAGVPIGVGPSSVPAASWAEALLRCLACSSSQSGILVDSAGLVIAIAGSWQNRTSEQIETLGARLHASVEQTLRLDEPCPVIAVALLGGWLSGLRVETPAGPLAIGLFGSAPVGVEVAALVCEEITVFVRTSRSP